MSIFNAPVGEYRCSVCGNRKAKSDMFLVKHTEDSVEGVGVLYRKAGVCKLCSGVTNPKEKVRKKRTVKHGRK